MVAFTCEVQQNFGCSTIDRRCEYSFHSGFTRITMTYLDQAIPLIPLDAAARAIVELRNADASYLHLAHPVSTPLSSILEPISRELDLPIIPFDEWLSSLEQSGEGLDASAEVEVARNNPALKLLDFFAKQAGRSGKDGVFGMKTLGVTEARRISRTLDELPAVTQEDVLGWVKYWRSIGFL